MLLICPVLLPITWNCWMFSFISWSGLSYFRILTICLLLVYFVSAAGCHCFDLYELDGFLCMVDHSSPRLPEILQFFSLASLHSKIERHCIFLLQFTSRIDRKWNWGLASHFFIYKLVAKGTKKRDAPSAAWKGGENEQLQYQIRDKDWNETGQTNKDLR